MKKLLMLLPLAFVVFAFRTPETAVAPEIPADIKPLLEKYGCTACHTMDKKLVGPKWPEIAAKKYSVKRIVALVKNPEPSNWPGYPPMAAQPTVPKKDLEKIAGWLVALK
jgi:cytochrome c